MRPSRIILVIAAAGLQAGVAVAAYQPGRDVPLAVADAVVGFTLLAAGVIAWDRRPISRVGLLMGLTGLAWTAGSVWQPMLLLHRGPLVHLLLGYPTGRLRRPVTVATVVIGYATVLIPAVADRADVSLGWPL